MNQDFLDLLSALLETEARFLVVGAHAMAVHGVPRATGDLDVWVSLEPENAERVWQSLLIFGAPLAGPDLSRSDLELPETVVQIGLPPRRIDLMTTLTGLAFGAAWPNRIMHRVGPLEIPFLGREDLVANKRATGRPKDLADLDVLEQATEE
jgi:hypothetical protein